MHKQDIAVEYDYYTLEQARKLILTDMETKRKRKKRIERQIENIKFYIMLFLFFVVAPMYMIIEWILVGY